MPSCSPPRAPIPRVVSSLCSLLELDKVRDLWSRAYQPATYREQACWRADWEDAMTAAPYLRVSVANVGASLHTMLELRGQLNVEGVHLDMIKADVERIWIKDLAVGTDARHALLDKAYGFDFQFAALTSQNTYITGVLSVKKKE